VDRRWAWKQTLRMETGKRMEAARVKAKRWRLRARRRDIKGIGVHT